MLLGLLNCFCELGLSSRVICSKWVNTTPQRLLSKQESALLSALIRVQSSQPSLASAHSILHLSVVGKYASDQDEYDWKLSMTIGFGKDADMSFVRNVCTRENGALRKLDELTRGPLEAHLLSTCKITPRQQLAPFAAAP